MRGCRTCIRVCRHGPCYISKDRSSRAVHKLISQTRRHTMQWTTPSYTDLRFGFEITMYIANR
ncbi:pyrroloquinoline quinone biosynthesis protein A [Burkholderia multivorans]